MTESNSDSISNKTSLDIPIEIVSDEEMAIIEAALAAAVRPVHFRSNVRSVHSITALSKRGLSNQQQPDLEDMGSFRVNKKTRIPDSLLLRFRNNKGLAVTDFTGTEWCEKQMEFALFNKRKVNKAMKAGTKRHVELEEEVVKKVTVHVESSEDRWALRLLNFITGVNQLLFEGLTRELPLISYVEGIWMVGVIDEIRMFDTEFGKRPLLVDIKTRRYATLPSEPQRRNGRLQLMCYKHMWDNLIAENFPTRKFFDHFSLNPYNTLSEDFTERAANLGFPVKTLEDMMRLYTNTSSMLPLAHDELLLRYEFQKDNSFLDEDQFPHDPDWLKKQIQGSLEFWRGEREASYTPEEERWKCGFCEFSTKCPINAKLENNCGTSSATNSTQDDNNPAN